ncbi:BTAD domain-containing putative transcriptional regulator [Kitasatospora cineracea]|uniref:AfsR/SARP family transcriptional regulator n=1 Tax=Kitasatospora cineracea TaxID=88074 RepID=UPI00381980B8
MSVVVEAGQGTGARFTVLGLLAIADRRESAVLQPSKPAALLAVLLTHPNAVVPVESLQRAIWGEEIPATAKASLHSCVLRLRRLFAKYGISGSTIEALPGGYRMAADARSLDLLEFRELLGRADRAAEPADELALLRAALELWQPPVLGNVHSDVLHREEVPRLAEEWLRTVERVYDIELALGRCREVLSELWPLARSHPAHERFWEQLIEALHRTGRRADALAEYRRVRDHLREELGVGPGPALQQLELAVLRSDPRTPPAAGAGTGVGAGAGEKAAGSVEGLGPGRGRSEAAPGPMAESVTGDAVLAGLVQAGLLREGPGGNYRVHELLRAFALAAEGSWARTPGAPEPLGAGAALGAESGAEPIAGPEAKPVAGPEAEPDRGAVPGAGPIPSVRQSAAPLRTTEV